MTGADARKALEVIQRETRRLARFVDDLLDLNRIRTGQLSFQLAAVDLGSVVRDVVSRLSEDAARVHAKIELSTQGHLVGHWDRVRLEQVVGNLLQNAIKFGEGRPIELAVTEADDAVRFICADHGVGIPAAMLGRIFDPYHRAVDARHYGGLGLGLHIAKTIVTGLGGTIAVESQPGQGATFTVTLPRDSACGQPMTLSAPILVLDDDDDVRDMLCMLLAAEGYRCMGFAAGADALARMREDERPALVVLDLMMPGMDGEAVVRHMTEDPSLTAIPIAVASGHANAREVEWARPISACLIKPIELDELISVVAQFARPMR